MTHFITTAMLAATLLALPAGAATPTMPQIGLQVNTQMHIVGDETYRPGQDGIDFTAITGPKGSHVDRLPACADPARRGNLRPC